MELCCLHWDCGCIQGVIVALALHFSSFYWLYVFMCNIFYTHINPTFAATNNKPLFYFILFIICFDKVNGVKADA